MSISTFNVVEDLVAEADFLLGGAAGKSALCNGGEAERFGGEKRGK